MNRRLLTPTRRRAFTFIELTVVFTVVAILAAILFPVFARAREAARKSNCAANLSQIGLALQLYARDHDGRFPPRDHDLQPLTTYLTDQSILRCPTDWAPAADWPGWRTVGFKGYQYRGGQSSEGRPDLPLAADWDFGHSNVATVLYLSGSVKGVNATVWMPVSRGPRPLPADLVPPNEIVATPFIGEDDDLLPNSPEPE